MKTSATSRWLTNSIKRFSTAGLRIWDSQIPKCSSNLWQSFLHSNFFLAARQDKLSWRGAHVSQCCRGHLQRIYDRGFRDCSTMARIPTRPISKLGQRGGHRQYWAELYPDPRIGSHYTNLCTPNIYRAGENPSGSKKADGTQLFWCCWPDEAVHSLGASHSGCTNAGWSGAQKTGGKGLQAAGIQCVETRNKAGILNERVSRVLEFIVGNAGKDEGVDDTWNGWRVSMANLGPGVLVSGLYDNELYNITSNADSSWRAQLVVEMGPQISYSYWYYDGSSTAFFYRIAHCPIISKLGFLTCLYLKVCPAMRAKVAL